MSKPLGASVIMLPTEVVSTSFHRLEEILVVVCVGVGH